MIETGAPQAFDGRFFRRRFFVLAIGPAFDHDARPLVAIAADSKSLSFSAVNLPKRVEKRKFAACLDTIDRCGQILAECADLPRPPFIPKIAPVDFLSPPDRF